MGPSHGKLPGAQGGRADRPLLPSGDGRAPGGPGRSDPGIRAALRSWPDAEPSQRPPLSGFPSLSGDTLCAHSSPVSRGGFCPGGHAASTPAVRSLSRTLSSSVPRGRTMPRIPAAARERGAVASAERSGTQDAQSRRSGTRDAGSELLAQTTFCPRAGPDGAFVVARVRK